MSETDALRRADAAAPGPPPGGVGLTATERALLAYLRVARRLYVAQASTVLLADARVLVRRGLAARATTESPFGETFVPTAAGLTGPPPEQWPPGTDQAEP
jgi:hypothetical protein